MWRKLLFLYNKPLSKEVAFDLMDRRIALTDLGHTRQDDEVMWKLAELVDEALLTLAADVYIKPLYGLDETEKLFDQFHNNRWMLENIVYKEHSSIQKRMLLEAAIQKNIHSEELQSLLTIVDQARLASRADLSIEDFQFLFKTNEPLIWLSLSKNPNTPADILNYLTDVKTIKNAKQIRNFARKNLGVLSRSGNSTTKAEILEKGLKHE